MFKHQATVCHRATLFNWGQQAMRALPGRGLDSVNGLWGWSWAGLRWVRAEWKQRSTSEVQLVLWRSFHRPQDRGLDSAQVVQQLSAGPSKTRMLPRFSGSLWNGNNRLHARDQINQSPDWREEEEEVIRGVVCSVAWIPVWHNVCHTVRGSNSLNLWTLWVPQSSQWFHEILCLQKTRLSESFSLH